MQTKKFYHVGRLMAISLVQGGSGFPFFAPPVYQYLCGVEMPTIELQDVPNFEVISLLEKVYMQIVMLLFLADSQINSRMIHA